MPYTNPGGGNVVGPASSTNNAVALYSGVTGKLLINSVTIINPTTGAISGFTTGTGLTLHGGGTIAGASGAVTVTATGALLLSGNTSSRVGTVGAGFQRVVSGIINTSNVNSADDAATAFTIANTTGAITFETIGTKISTALATTSTDGWVLANTTAATSGVPVQISPRLRLRTPVWNTNGAGAAHVNDMFIEALGVSADPTSTILKFGSIINGAAATYPMTLTSGGLLSTGSISTGVITSGAITSGSVNATGNVIASATLKTGLTNLNSDGVEGSLRLSNNNGDDFGLLKFGGLTTSFPALKRESAELTAKLADDSAVTFIKAKLRASSGAAGANFSGAPLTITVVDGVVTAVA